MSHKEPTPEFPALSHLEQQREQDIVRARLSSQGWTLLCSTPCILAVDYLFLTWGPYGTDDQGVPYGMPVWFALLTITVFTLTGWVGWWYDLITYLSQRRTMRRQGHVHRLPVHTPEIEFFDG